MARPGAPRDHAKEQFWRRLLRLWQASGRTIRAFCAEQGVSQASFFAWRRTIAQRDQPHAAPPESSAAFVPLRVIARPTAPPAQSFEVVLNDDRVVRVPAGFDPASLRQLLAILEEEQPC
jgi:transposase